MPILNGIVERIGGVRRHLNNETVDALEVKGYPEWRRLHGKSYIVDHLRTALGKQAVVGISGRILVAVKYNGRVYPETGFKTVINSGGFLIGISTVLLTVMVFTFPVAVLMFLLLRSRVKRLVAEVQLA